eukprot:3537129-Amphidinium_carterae.1
MDGADEPQNEPPPASDALPDGDGGNEVPQAEPAEGNEAVEILNDQPAAQEQVPIDVDELPVMAKSIPDADEAAEAPPE